MKNLIERLTLRSELIYRGYTTETQITYIREVERFLDWINKEIVDIVRSDLVRYLNSEKETKDINTIIVQLNALEFFFRECLGINTADEIECFRREFKSRRLMTQAEIKEIVGRVSERERIILLLLLETPMKLVDILEIKVEDIKQYEKLFEINGYEISIDIARSIYDYIERNDIEAKVFPHHKTTIQKAFAKYSLQYLGYEFSLKDLKYSRGLEIIKKAGEKEGAIFLGYDEIRAMRQYYRRIGYVYKK